MEIAKAVLNILVVDDDAALRSFAGALLEDLGYSALLADGGRAAVQLLLLNPEAVDAVLLDMTMPGLSPEETLRHLVEIKPGLPVLILSGDEESSVRARFKPGSIAGYIQKPYSDVDLEAGLARAFAGQGRRDGGGAIGAAASDAPLKLERLTADEVATFAGEHIEKCRSELPLMAAYLEDRNFASLKLMGHRLKGSSGCFGLPELSSLGLALEECAASADGAACAQQVQALREHLEHL